MTSVLKIDGEQLINVVDDLSIQDQNEMQSQAEIHDVGFGSHSGICAICLDNIVLEETAIVKVCEHAYCVTCILRWATCSKKATCPQCKHPFEFLNVHRSLDGSIHDYMFEESVCLLLRAPWFKPLSVVDHSDHQDHDLYDYTEDYYPYEDENEDLDVYYSSSSSLRLGNRRWGDNGYVRAGHQEARPVYRPNFQDSGVGSSRERRKKEATGKITTGRRAKRALKREAADKAAAAKHQQHLARLGRT
ncbi:RING/U-box superfamily protein [Quillaja saponaria]|uniref:RING/U-box superfamily protein n=1 Tax=Quillaja saponaria TaxID=32244 RepID=A0AAD7LLY9_QUISA|nr:RING/U-box superfamily protein [Quillaja saponaria]